MERLSIIFDDSYGFPGRGDDRLHARHCTDSAVSQVQNRNKTGIIIDQTAILACTGDARAFVLLVIHPTAIAVAGE